MTFEEFSRYVARRRTITGENYSKASKLVLDFLKESGSITEEEYRAFDIQSKRH
jgi:hypothetical protein